MFYASPLIFLQWIVTSVFVFPSVIRASFLVRSNHKEKCSKDELYNSKEESVLQCAQRCTLITKDALMEFDELKMMCACFNCISKKVEETGTDLSMFRKRKIEKYKRRVNYALNKPSHQSTTEDLYTKPNNAYFANDGDTATRSATQFDKNENEWWQLDMLGVVKIGMIKILLGPWSLSEGNYKNLTILTRVSGTDPWEKCDAFANPTELSVETGCQPPRSARFVKIMTFFKNALYLTEVEVYE